LFVNSTLKRATKDQTPTIMLMKVPFTILQGLVNSVIIVWELVIRRTKNYMGIIKK
jgi:hypothetical protein